MYVHKQPMHTKPHPKGVQEILSRKKDAVLFFSMFNRNNNNNVRHNSSHK